MQRMKLILALYIHKLIQKLINDLNLRATIIRYLEENVRKIFMALDLAMVS